jgi:hypothetical protein
MRLAGPQCQSGLERIAECIFPGTESLSSRTLTATLVMSCLSCIYRICLKYNCPHSNLSRIDIKKKVKLSLFQGMETCNGVRRRGSHISWRMAVRLSVSYAPAALYPSPTGRLLVLIGVRRWVNPNAIMQLKGVGSKVYGDPEGSSHRVRPFHCVAVGKPLRLPHMCVTRARNICHVMWVPCRHSMARPRVADAGNGLQLWNTLNK